MSETIFIDEFPEAKTDTELEEIAKKFPQYDRYYIASWSIKERNIFFDKLWQKFKPYADSNFKKEIKTNFHQRSWEMYVGNLFLNEGLFIKSNNKGPDFIINNNIYIECIGVTKGDPKKHNSVPEMVFARNLEEICVQDIPIDKMILRITQAIKDKAIDQYERWKNKKWFNENAPFIIAINTWDLGYGQDHSLALKALFGLGSLQINQKGNKNFGWREEIKKWDTIIPVNYFTNENFNFVSGVLFSTKNILYYEENWDDCVIINNPYARNPITKNDFLFLDQRQTEIDKNGIMLNYIKKNTIKIDIITIKWTNSHRQDN